MLLKDLFPIMCFNCCKCCCNCRVDARTILASGKYRRNVVQELVLGHESPPILDKQQGDADDDAPKGRVMMNAVSV